MKKLQNSPIHAIMNTCKKAFTLMETLIVLVIIGILSVSLIRSYTLISELSFEIEQEKQMQEESLVLLQTLQSLADEASIDYQAYINNNWNLTWKNGITDILYLTGGMYTGTVLYTTWNCLTWTLTWDDFADLLYNNSWCQLVMKKDDRETPLLNNQWFITSQATFKILPFDSIKNIYTNWVWNDDIYQAIRSPSFTISLHWYSKFYEPTGRNKIDLPLTLFFNTNSTYHDTSL